MKIKNILISRSAESCFSEKSVESKTSSYEEEMDTGIEIFLAPDYGRQGNAFFKVIKYLLFNV